MEKQAFKNQIIAVIRENRLKISDSSVSTYVSLLTNLLKKMELPQQMSSFTTNKKEILKYLSDPERPSQTVKTVLSALYSTTNDEDYRSKSEQIIGYN